MIEYYNRKSMEIGCFLILYNVKVLYDKETPHQVKSIVLLLIISFYDIAVKVKIDFICQVVFVIIFFSLLSWQLQIENVDVIDAMVHQLGCGNGKISVGNGQWLDCKREW